MASAAAAKPRSIIGVNVFPCRRLGAVGSKHIFPADGWRQVRVGQDHHPGLLGDFQSFLAMVHGPAAVTGFEALEAF